MATAEARRGRPGQDRGRRGRAGSGGVRTCPSGRGARCARTTARTATRGTSSRTTTPARGPTDGTRTASAGICDDQQTPLLRVRVLERPRPDPEGAHLRSHRQPRATTARTPRSTGSTWTRTPTHSWMRWRYLYPQAEFPYEQLVDENAAAADSSPEYELLDTGIFDEDRYWDITVDYAKADADDIVRPGHASATPGPMRRRCTCCRPCGFATRGRGASTIDARPSPPTARRARRRLTTTLGRMRADRRRRAATPLLRQRDQRRAAVGRRRRRRSRRTASTITSSHGATTVNPAQTGTKAALLVPARRCPRRDRRDPSSACTATQARRPSTADATCWRPRSAEADEFYAALTPDRRQRRRGRGAAPGTAPGCCGRSSSTTTTWRAGSTATRLSRPRRRAGCTGRNHDWRHLNNPDVISMPDKWEYPWYAAWDLAFHCVALAHVDPEFAKEQLLLLCREWYMHPNGQLPAYEWKFSDVNPPVHAWAALRVFEIDGATDFEFLERVLHKLLLNFTWWVNRKDADGNNVFDGGFLGLDNIGPIDRSAPLPIDGVLEQSDGTAWMAMYCLDLLEIALDPGRARPRPTRISPPSSSSTSPTSPTRCTSGACGTTRTASTTTCCTATTATRIPLQLPLDGRSPTDRRHDHSRSRDPRQAAGLRRPAATGSSTTVPTTPTPSHMHERDGGEGRLLSIVSPGATATRSCVGCSTRPSSSRPTACAPCRPRTAISRSRSTSAG